MLRNLNGVRLPDPPPCLRIPDVSGATVAEAAALYAEANIRVLPLDGATKHPGSVLGSGWQRRASCRAGSVDSYFKRSTTGVGLVLGQSGLIVFDVDDADMLPVRLRKVLSRADHPFQSTRRNASLRGHHVFKVPGGRKIGCPTRFLGAGWGEVKSWSGFVVAQPTPHSKAHAGGAYVWLDVGEVPDLPAELEQKLPEYRGVSSLGSAGMAADEVIAGFIEANDSANRPGLLGALVRRAEEAVAEREARHEVLVRLLPQAMREARYGFYAAADALAEMEQVFMSGGGNHLGEWHGLVRHAIAAALSDEDHDERKATAEERLAPKPPTVGRSLSPRRPKPPTTRDQAARAVAARYSRSAR